MGEVCLDGEKNDRMAFQARANYQESCHRRAAKGIQFPWRWDAGTISTNFDGIWGMSAQRFSNQALRYIIQSEIVKLY